MLRYILIITFFFFGNCNLANGQTSLNNNQSIIYKNIPQENIFVHFNTSLLFSGDYLYYKIYDINSQTKKLSQLSKIAYIELIGKDKKNIFRHKVKLNSGVGEGDYFIPTSIPSGNYKLIAYTQWMRNVGDHFYFQADVCIINPFLENQEAVVVKSSDLILNKTNYQKSNKITNKLVELKLNKTSFSKREKVNFQINAAKDASSFGNYSVSVKKIDSIMIPNRPNSNTYKSNYSQPQSKLNNQTIYLPELRGELLSGTVIEKGSAKKIALKNVSLSITGRNSVFKTSVTNDSGIFYFNLDEPYETLNADLHIIDNNPEKYKIIINQNPPLNYNELIFNDFKISSEMKELILERSINNQIENAYSSAKQHKILAEEEITSFYHGQGITYNLDDFTRFKTVKETFVEIVADAWIEKQNGSNAFRVKIDQPIIKGLSPLIIVDGLIVLNHSDLINYDSRKIQKISVVNSRYRYGGNVFEGILSVETIKNDFKNSISEKYVKNIMLDKPQNKKNYFNQTYNNNEEFNHIPDYRSQLFWLPSFNLDKKENSFTFYTSDFEGRYEINLEGFTNDGVPVSIKEFISVK